MKNKTQLSQTPKDWFEQIPDWLMLSLIPVVGGLAIVYAGHKTKTKSWLILGGSITTAAIILAFAPTSLNLLPMWIVQVSIAFSIKKSYLIKTYPKNLPLPGESSLATSIAENRDKIDINLCSKHEMVYSLGLPLPYANDIEELRNSGYIFTDAEELTEIVGIPEITVKRIAPLITFSYDYNKEANISWRRLNSQNVAQLTATGLSSKDATKIVTERERNGDYKSIIDLRRRTGIPLSAVRHLL
ncbi:helix-hairpin-helix domain-containing protein [[Phormidium] sp. ETS-05]|uniref:helix-hairpin-helix domain-containing protein n=1 Tax=[Phormidium] sp. ETS-05 TaxID=222819 RepID=UPI0018EF0E3F|nr:helix-hairpin-helix domain-containing protein [[Phormidium] sp. ETS-05]